MKILVTCNYCGESFVKEVYIQSLLPKQCFTCNDKNLTLLNLDKDKVDYYAGRKEVLKTKDVNYYEGAPEFPSKEKKEESWGYF